MKAKTNSLNIHLPFLLCPLDPHLHRHNMLLAVLAEAGSPLNADTVIPSPPPTDLAQPAVAAEDWKDTKTVPTLHTAH